MFCCFVPFCFFNSRKGSVVAESIALYNYENNGTQIQFLNTQLDSVLTDIFNDTKNLVGISQAFGSDTVLLHQLTLQPPPVTSTGCICFALNCISKSLGKMQTLCLFFTITQAFLTCVLLLTALHMPTTLLWLLMRSGSVLDIAN